MDFCMNLQKIEAFALFLSILGILILNFWPVQSQYSQTGIAQIKIVEEGKWVNFSGTVSKITAKEGGNSLSVCDSFSRCISVYAAEGTAGSWVADDPLYAKGEVNVLGEVGIVSSNRFVRAHKIEIGE